MEKTQQEIDILTLWRLVWNRRRRVLYCGLIGCVMGIIVAFSIPKEYETNVIIAPEKKDPSSSLASMGALAGIMGVNLSPTVADGVGEKLYPEILKSTPFLLEFVSVPVEYKGQQISLNDYMLKFQKQAWWKTLLESPFKFVSWLFSKDSDGPLTEKQILHKQQAFIGKMARLVKIQEDKQSGVYQLTAVMQDPEISMQVADSLLVKLQRYMTDYRTTKIRQDLENSQKMLAEAKAQYYAIDMEYAQAADRNQKLVSKSAQTYVERLSNERDLAFTIYQQVASQVETNKIKLQENTPIATVIEPARLPLYAAHPNKKLIVAAFLFLGMMVSAGFIVVKTLIVNDEL